MNGEALGKNHGKTSELAIFLYHIDDSKTLCLIYTRK